MTRRWSWSRTPAVWQEYAGQLVAGERGARQVTLDDAGPRAAANADPTGFVEVLELPVVIDEFQKAVELLPAIKSRVDRARSGGRRAAGMFLLTGRRNVGGSPSRSPVAPSGLSVAASLSGGDPGEPRDVHRCGARWARRPGHRPARGVEALVAGGYPEMLARGAGSSARELRADDPGARRARFSREGSAARRASAAAWERRPRGSPVCWRSQTWRATRS